MCIFSGTLPKRQDPSPHDEPYSAIFGSQDNFSPEVDINSALSFLKSDPFRSLKSEARLRKPPGLAAGCKLVGLWLPDNCNGQQVMTKLYHGHLRPASP